MSSEVWADAQLLDMLAMRDAGLSMAGIARRLSAATGAQVSRAAVQGALRRIDHDYAASCGDTRPRFNRRLALGRERRAKIEPLVRSGLSAPQIAERLGLNVHTVKSQCRKIREAMVVAAEAEARRA